MQARYILVLTTIIIAILIIIVLLNRNEEESIKIFHAGSLSIPFDDLAKEFEKEYRIKVYREAAGSVSTIKKITNLRKHADIVASADYTLIEDMMEPDYSDYCIQFATNSIVIAYTDESRYNKEINRDNWYEILGRNGVRFGFSDPNKDPCGYRTMMVLQLASIYYHNEMIFDDLIEKNTPIKNNYTNNSYIVYIPDSSSLISNEKIMIRPMEIDLMAALESNEIDYLFIYESVARQHAVSGVRYITLGDAIDLSNPERLDDYNKVTIEMIDGREITAKPIVYGITIPKNAEHKDYAVKFIELLLGEKGREILIKNGQKPLQPAICDHKDLLPDSIKPYVK